MPPLITGFYPGPNLPQNTNGLNSKNGSSNAVIIGGDNVTMTKDMAVYVTNNAGVTWSGTLATYDSNNVQWSATLTCVNTSTDIGASQSVDVTVGTAPNSTTVNFTRVNVQSA
jgi:hypothetical protein